MSSYLAGFDASFTDDAAQDVAALMFAGGNPKTERDALPADQFALEGQPAASAYAAKAQRVSSERNDRMPTPSGEPWHILLVDDNPDLLASVSFALRMAGLHVETANDGMAGLERAVELQPDCMVIDVKMPEIDGLQLVRALRGDPATADIPLVMLSALVQQSDQTLGMYAGADQYLTKPAKPNEIIAAIQKAIHVGAEERLARLRALAQDDLT